jgi:hypothetical protein
MREIGSKLKKVRERERETHRERERERDTQRQKPVKRGPKHSHT